jgi:uncharacterized protein with FMN-binding domain
MLLAIIALVGCSSGERPVAVEQRTSPDGPVETSPASPVADLEATPEAESTSAAQTAEEPNALAASVQTETINTLAAQSVVGTVPDAKDQDAGPAEPVVSEKAAPAATSPAAERPVARPTLDELLAKLEVPPPWLDGVSTQWDTSKPWKDARLEVRRLLGFGRVETHREALKLTWLYLQKGDIGDGHEVPMYTFLGGEPVWSVRAHEEFLAKPHENPPTHVHLTLASLYAQFGEFEKAKATLDVAMNDLPGPPWQVMRKADVLDALGDVYAAWGNTDDAKRCYAESVALYPTAKPPYGGHLLPRRAARVQSKLDLLTFRSLATAALRDGQYRDQALGYAGDIGVTVVIREGKIADIQLKHEEKIDQNACVLIPQRIIAAQSLQVDGISGATVTKEAIVDGVYQCLKKAGLQ